MKKTYIAPEMEIVELTMDDIIMTSNVGASGGDYDKYNTAIWNGSSWDWGDGKSSQDPS